MRFWFHFPATPSSDATRAQRRRSLLLATVLIAVLPLAWRGTSCGQDFDFHLQSWLEVVSHWRHGILYPHWAASANYLAGEPRFVFYPPLSWIFGGLLSAILPWSWTPVAYTLIALLTAGFAFRKMASAWMPPDSATIAACLYVANPYMLFVVYERGALAELLAATWIPLLVLYALRDDPDRARTSVVPLAFTVAALWLTNLPAAVMGSYALAVLVAIAALQQRANPRNALRLILRSALAVPLGLALAGFWLIPAIYEQRWVEIQRAVGPLMRVEDSFLFGYVPLPTSPQDRFDTIYHNGVLQTVSWITIALIIVAAVASLWPRVARLRKKPRPSGRGPGSLENVWPSGPGLFAPFTITATLIVFLQFPWSAPLWRHIPELQYLQFPWRWLLVLALIAAALTGLALRSEQTTRRAIASRGGAILLIACGMATLSAIYFWQPCDDEDNITAQRAAFVTKGFEGSDEYTLQGVDASTLAGIVSCLSPSKGPVLEVIADNTSDPGVSPTPIPATVQTLAWTPERIAALVTTPRPGFAVLYRTDYPAWRITRNGAQIDHPTHRNDGLLVIPIAAGATRIDIRWRLTTDQWLGIVLSLIALAITLTLAISNRTRVPHSNFAERRN